MNVRNLGSFSIQQEVYNLGDKHYWIQLADGSRITNGTIISDTNNKIEVKDLMGYSVNGKNPMEEDDDEEEDY